MRKTLMSIVLGLSALLCGCVPSLHPLYTEKDLIFEPALVGEWSDEDGKETWAFTAKGGKAYKLVYTDGKKKQGRFVAHLLEVKGQMFLDLFPEDPELEANDFYKCHLLPVHTFLRVAQIEPVLQMTMLDPDWLKKLLTKDPEAVRYEKIDDRILLTAPPKALQGFLQKHAGAEAAWGEFSQLRRRQ